MPLFRPNRVVLQPIFYMFTGCMLCMEKSIDRWKLWVNQWTPWKNRWTVQMANFSSKIQQSTGFCQNVANRKEKSQGCTSLVLPCKLDGCAGQAPLGKTTSNSSFWFFPLKQSKSRMGFASARFDYRMVMLPLVSSLCYVIPKRSK